MGMGVGRVRWSALRPAVAARRPRCRAARGCHRHWLRCCHRSWWRRFRSMALSDGDRRHGGGTPSGHSGAERDRDSVGLGLGCAHHNHTRADAIARGQSPHFCTIVTHLLSPDGALSSAAAAKMAAAAKWASVALAHLRARSFHLAVTLRTHAHLWLCSLLPSSPLPS